MVALELSVERPVCVLLVEDEVLIRAVVADALRDSGCTVVEAADADEALALIKTAVRPDIVITDVNMPGELDGMALAARIREEHPRARIIITSGRVAAVGNDVCADAFLPKPFELHALVRRVHALAGS